MSPPEDLDEMVDPKVQSVSNDAQRKESETPKFQGCGVHSDPEKSHRSTYGKCETKVPLGLHD